MKRELSVEDLFGPLNRLDVRHPSASSTLVEPLQNNNHSRVADAEVAESRRTLLDAHSAHVSASAARLSSAFMVSIPEETGLISHAEKPVAPGLGLGLGLGLTIDCAPEEGISAALPTRDHTHTWKFSSSTFSKNVNASLSDGGMGLQTQGNSTSDEDQQVLDDRKQRRMLSNRESARRSRLRKQQHLDELRGHVALLLAQNSQMLNSFNLASQQFAQITEENQKLRTEAMALSHQLQRLHHTLTSQRASNGLLRGGDTRQTVQGPHY
ncbi:hypothetical protein L7F22_003562 [Adiantum nelumboides]|nr:hypothetical protein [Adiantum nelumboides]